MDDVRLTRRGSLVKVGGFLAAVLAAGGWKASSAEGTGLAGVASGAVQCVLTPELTEGPYAHPERTGSPQCD